MTDRIYKWLELVLGVDIRSLALFRVLLGSIVLYDLCVRVNYVIPHYTDQGILPRWVLKGISENPLLLSLNVLSGEPLWQIILFVIAICSAVLFIVGYRANMAALLCSVLLLSIHVRNPFLNNLGDWFLLNLLFWSCLLPVGAISSLDAKARKESVYGSKTFLSVASMGVIFQIIYLYFFSTFYKISPIWHTEKSAIYYALSLDRLVTSAGESVLNLPVEWLMGMTQATLVLEKWGPLFLFLPLFTVSVRSFIIGSFILFHLGLALTLELGIFPFVCIAAWALLIPGVLWDKISQRNVMVNRLFRSTRKLHTIDPAKKTASINWGGAVVSIFLLWVTLSSNLLHTGRMGEYYYERTYKYIEPLVNSLNLRQRWNMFSPHPSKQDGWFLLVGVQADGTLINLMEGGNRVDWQRPSDISSTYKNQRWRKNLEWVMMRWDPHARLVAEYMKRNWNSIHKGEQQVEKVSIYFMSEYTLESFESTPIERKLLYEK